MYSLWRCCHVKGNKYAVIVLYWRMLGCCHLEKPSQLFSVLNSFYHFCLQSYKLFHLKHTEAAKV